MNFVKCLKYVRPKFALIALRNLFGNVNTPKRADKRITKKGGDWSGRNKYYDSLLEHIPRGVKTVLDVGCAAGDGCVHIKSKLPQVEIEGCDWSKVSLRYARKKTNKIKFFCLDITKGEIRGNYDCIILSHIIEHLTEYDQAIIKCLKRCKTLIISCPYNERVSIFGLKPIVHLHSFNENTLTKYSPEVFIKKRKICYVIRGGIK